MISAPLRSLVSRVCGVRRTQARDRRRSARFDRMRSRTVPPVISSTSGATASAMVLTVLAPMASRTSTIRCSTSIGPRGVSANTCASMSWQPPPRPISTWSRLLASLTMRSRSRSRATRAPCGSVRPSTCTWARISGRVLEVSKPPFSRASLAMNEAAATTDGSSTAIGTSTSRPLTWKLPATPSGSSKAPMTFSIMPSARSRPSAPGSASCWRSSGVRPAASAMAARRWAGVRARKLGRRESATMASVSIGKSKNWVARF